MVLAAASSTLSGNPVIEEEIVVNNQSQPRPTVVLVHGAWGDASAWQRVIPLLVAEKVEVVAVQNSTESLSSDAATARRALARVSGPVVLVGHSWGGSVISEVGQDPKVKALVFVAAFAPQSGESAMKQVDRYDAAPAATKIISDDEGFLFLTRQAWIEDVASDLPIEEAEVLAVSQTPLGGLTFGEKVGEAAWLDQPTWYVVSSEDCAVSVALQRDAALRMEARTTEIESGHMFPLSHPRAVADVILDAVAFVANGSTMG